MILVRFLQFLHLLTPIAKILIERNFAPSVPDMISHLGDKDSSTFYSQLLNMSFGYTMPKVVGSFGTTLNSVLSHAQHKENSSEIADWLNAKIKPTDPYTRFELMRGLRIEMEEEYLDSEGNKKKKTKSVHDIEYDLNISAKMEAEVSARYWLMGYKAVNICCNLYEIYSIFSKYQAIVNALGMAFSIKFCVMIVGVSMVSFGVILLISSMQEKELIFKKISDTTVVKAISGMSIYAEEQVTRLKNQASENLKNKIGEAGFTFLTQAFSYSTHIILNFVIFSQLRALVLGQTLTVGISTINFVIGLTYQSANLHYGIGDIGELVMKNGLAKYTSLEDQKAKIDAAIQKKIGNNNVKISTPKQDDTDDYSAGAIKNIKIEYKVKTDKGKNKKITYTPKDIRLQYGSVTTLPGDNNAGKTSICEALAYGVSGFSNLSCEVYRPKNIAYITSRDIENSSENSAEKRRKCIEEKLQNCTQIWLAERGIEFKNHATTALNKKELGTIIIDEYDLHLSDVEHIADTQDTNRLQSPTKKNVTHADCVQSPRNKMRDYLKDWAKKYDVAILITTTGSEIKDVQKS